MTAHALRAYREKVRRELRTDQVRTKWTATLVAPRWSECRPTGRSTDPRGSVSARPAGCKRAELKGLPPARLQGSPKTGTEVSHEARAHNSHRHSRIEPGQPEQPPDNSPRQHTRLRLVVGARGLRGSITSFAVPRHGQTHFRR